MIGCKEGVRIKFTLLEKIGKIVTNDSLIIFQINISVSNDE